MAKPQHASGVSSDEVERIIGLDVVTADGVVIGEVAALVDEVEEDRMDAELGPVDGVPAGRDRAPDPRVRIDCAGMPIQAELCLPLSQLQIDLRGRRVTIPLTVEQVRSLPRGGAM